MTGHHDQPLRLVPR